MLVEFLLSGESAILFHADDVEASDSLKAWREDPDNASFSVRGDDRSPAWTWQTYLYHDGEKVVWPSANLMVGLRQAGAQLILKKQKTFKEITQSSIMPEAEFFEFLCRGKPVSFADVVAMKEAPFADQSRLVRDLGFSLFVKRAKVGQSKHVRVRARFDAWGIRGRVEVTAPEITFEVLTKLFELAGHGGQGDWRPACKTPGPFGRFSAKLKKVG